VLHSAKSAEILNRDILAPAMYKKYSYTLALSTTGLVGSKYSNIVLDIIFMYIKNKNVEPL